MQTHCREVAMQTHWPSPLSPRLSAVVSQPSSLGLHFRAGLNSAFKPVSGSLKKWDPLRDPKFWQSNKVENSKPKLFLGCQRHRTGTSGSTSQMIINVETCVLVPVSMLLGLCTNWPRWLQRSSYSDEEVVARLSD